MIIRNADTRASVSDQTIKLGTIKISDIMDSLGHACKDEGLCDTSAIDIKGQLIEAGAEGEIDDETLTINPFGSYPTWIHNGLLETLSAAVQAVAKCEDVTQWSGCASVMAYCPRKSFFPKSQKKSTEGNYSLIPFNHPANKITVNECTVPQYWGINYQAADSSNAAPPSIEADMSIVVDKGGFCDTFTTVGNAVAGKFA